MDTLFVCVSLWIFFTYCIPRYGSNQGRNTSPTSPFSLKEEKQHLPILPTRIKQYITAWMNYNFRTSLFLKKSPLICNATFWYSVAKLHLLSITQFLVLPPSSPLSNIYMKHLGKLVRRYKLKFQKNADNTQCKISFTSNVNSSTFSFLNALLKSPLDELQRAWTPEWY